ncbi:MAG: hypothetical protein KJ899_13500, partial [Gammaproteobacteria bacterium]|nr:hypothetical protein [Gammaproteobacteria bacterium]
LGANGSTLAVDAGYVVNDGNGGANYTVVSNTATGTITPASLTVTADNLSKFEGTADPVLTYTASGLQTGDTAVSTLSGTLVRDPGELLGDYAINQGSVGLTTNNYTMSFVPGTFSIIEGAPITPPLLSALVEGTMDFGLDSQGDDDDKPDVQGDPGNAGNKPGNDQGSTPMAVCQ